MVPVEDRDDEFVVGAGKEVVLIRWDGRSGQATALRVLGEVDKLKPANRINDGKCDPSGRLYFGTMGDNVNTDLKEFPTASFFQFRVGEEPLVIKNSTIGISNGLTWNAALGKFYYIDSVRQDVKVFDHNPLSGSLGEIISEY